MLHVERGPDVDAGAEQFLDVLPALRMPRRRQGLLRVRMRQLIDQQDRGPAAQRRVEIELVARRAAQRHLREGQLLQPLQQLFGVAATVRLDVSDDEVRAPRACGARRLEHRVGLADTGRGAEEDAQATAPRPRLVVLQPDRRRARSGSLADVQRHDVAEAGRAPRAIAGVQREVEPQHVHARFAQQAEAAPLACSRQRVHGPDLRPGRARAPRAPPATRRRRARCAGRGRCPRPSRVPPAPAARRPGRAQEGRQRAPAPLRGTPDSSARRSSRSMTRRCRAADRWPTAAHGSSAAPRSTGPGAPSRVRPRACGSGCRWRARASHPGRCRSPPADTPRPPAA